MFCYQKYNKSLEYIIIIAQVWINYNDHLLKPKSCLIAQTCHVICNYMYCVVPVLTLIECWYVGRCSLHRYIGLSWISSKSKNTSILVYKCLVAMPLLGYQKKVIIERNSYIASEITCENNWWIMPQSWISKSEWHSLETVRAWGRGNTFEDAGFGQYRYNEKNCFVRTVSW